MQAFTGSLRDRYVLERELGRGGMAVANRPGPAMDQLEETPRRRDFYSRGWRRIDGTIAPLRTNPRFQRLVASDPPS